MSILGVNTIQTAAGAQGVTHDAFVKAWASIEGGAALHASYNISSYTDTAADIADVSLTNSFNAADGYVAVMAGNHTSAGRTSVSDAADSIYALDADGWTMDGQNNDAYYINSMAAGDLA